MPEFTTQRAAILFITILALGAGIAYMVRFRSAPPLPNLPNPLPKPYLLLVTFVTAYTPADIRVFSRSPYDGVAVPLVSAYNIGVPPATSSVQTTFASLKAQTTKDIWPWVFLNRMVGGGNNPSGSGATPAYFKNIKGLDLNDTTGSRTDFIDLWTDATQEAHILGSPGVVFDPEYYNSNDWYHLKDLSAEIGQSPQATITLLEGLGAQMADVAGQEMPGGNILVLFSDLTAPQDHYQGNSYYQTPAYIVEGMLQEILKKHLNLVIIDGGEDSLDYCSTSLDSLQSKVTSRGGTLAQAVGDSTGHLILGGTMTLWSDTGAKHGWEASGVCAESPAKNIEQLEPYLKTLLSTYSYVWIFASDQGGYDAFSANATQPFNTAIRSVEGVR